MNSEIINERILEKSIWNDRELIEAFENHRDEHTSEISEINKPWRYDIDPEELGLLDLKVDHIFMHNGNPQTCKLTKMPVFRNIYLNKNFSEIKPKKLKKELASHIRENYTHVNSIIEHRQSAVNPERVVDMVYYMICGIKIDVNGNS